MSAALLSGQNSRHESVHAERSQHASHCPDEHVHVDPAATADSILHGHGVHHHHIQVGGSGALSWVVCCLLSVHAAVTGAALGMTTTVRSTIILAVVIIAHKGGQCTPSHCLVYEHALSLSLGRCRELRRRVQLRRSRAISINDRSSDCVRIDDAGRRDCCCDGEGRHLKQFKLTCSKRSRSDISGKFPLCT